MIQNKGERVKIDQLPDQMQPRGSGLVPIVIEQTARGERSFDIYSRLLKERVEVIDLAAFDSKRFNKFLIYFRQLTFFDVDHFDLEISCFTASF